MNSFGKEDVAVEGLLRLRPTPDQYRTFCEYLCDAHSWYKHLPLMERCQFVLYPYVSRTFAEAVIWSVHEEALADLRAGAAHPARDEVLELARLAEALGPAWDALGEREQGWVLVRHREGEEPWSGEQSEVLRRYLALDDQVIALTELLREREAGKVRWALAALDGSLTDAERHSWTPNFRQ
jgi:hypothetical protein